jgi:hypothetical protein
VRFRLGDLWGDAYIRDKGERKGEAAASLKARLLKTEPLDRAELASIKQHELITRGIGYLNRVKDVTPKAGDSFLSCTVAALAGPVDEPEYRYFDTIVATPEAEHLVRRCVQAIEGDRKVLIAFRLNDMKIDPYIRTKGEHAGEPAASLESTLVHIGLIKIDGTQVYPTSQVSPKTTPRRRKCRLRPWRRQPRTVRNFHLGKAVVPSPPHRLRPSPCPMSWRTCWQW